MSDHSDISSLDDCKMPGDAQNIQATLSLQSSLVVAEPRNRFELGFNQPMVKLLMKQSLCCFSVLFVLDINSQCFVSFLC